MSKETCDMIIGLLLRDDQFRVDFDRSRDRVLDAFTLTSQERAEMLNLKSDQLTAGMTSIIAKRRDTDTEVGCG